MRQSPTRLGQNPTDSEMRPMRIVGLKKGLHSNLHYETSAEVSFYEKKYNIANW